jgi:hypothetical protein
LRHAVSASISECPRLARGMVTLVANTRALSTPSSPFSSGGSAAAGERGRRGFDVSVFVAANVKLPQASRGHRRHVQNHGFHRANSAGSGRAPFAGERHELETALAGRVGIGFPNCQRSKGAVVLFGRGASGWHESSHSEVICVAETERARNRVREGEPKHGRRAIRFQAAVLRSGAAELARLRQTGTRDVLAGEFLDVAQFDAAKLRHLIGQSPPLAPQALSQVPTSAADADFAVTEEWRQRLPNRRRSHQRLSQVVRLPEADQLNSQLVGFGDRQAFGSRPTPRLLPDRSRRERRASRHRSALDRIPPPSASNAHVPVRPSERRPRPCRTKWPRRSDRAHPRGEMPRLRRDAVRTSGGNSPLPLGEPIPPVARCPSPAAARGHPARSGRWLAGNGRSGDVGKPR